MSQLSQDKGFLYEFRKFIDFLQNLWGLLSGISIFFPLSNVLLEVIPMRTTQDDPAGGWSYLSPALVTSLTTMITLFVLLWTFGQRRVILDSVQINAINRRAWVSIIIGLLSLIFYLGLHTAVLFYIYELLNITHGDPGAFLGDVSLFLSYAGFFALVSRAFVLLGMKEYILENKK